MTLRNSGEFADLGCEVGADIAVGSLLDFSTGLSSSQRLRGPVEYDVNRPRVRAQLIVQ